MSSDDEKQENIKINNDPLKEERERARRLIDETFLGRITSRKIILYDETFELYK